MPNHITNKIHFKGNTEIINQAMEFLKIKDDKLGTIDFNNITPMPK